MWSTVVKWVAILGLGLVLAEYYNPGLLKNILPQQTQPSQPISPPQKPVDKKSRSKKTQSTRADTIEPLTRTSETAVSKKRKIATHAKDGTATTPITTNEKVGKVQAEDNSMNNKDFAQQLAKAQNGTQFKQAGNDGTSKKERRAAKTVARNAQSEALTSTSSSAGMLTDTSSATGQEGDDSASLHNSPSIPPAITPRMANGQDISDMLEAPAPKPMTLRLTDIKDTDSKAERKLASNAFEPVMTKKKTRRQVQKEQQRAAFAETDRLHEQKKQQQLRTARMAAGTSNQTKANAFAATAQNAWVKPNPETKAAPAEAPQVNPVPLLDTFDHSEDIKLDPSSAINEKSVSQLTNGTSSRSNVNALKTEMGGKKVEAAAASGREQPVRPSVSNHSHSSWADQVDEEEQNKWASQLVEQGQWESVASKKTKKKGGKNQGDTSSDASSAVIQPQPVQSSKQAASGVKTNETVNKFGTTNRFQAVQSPKRSDADDGDWEA